MTRQLTVLFAGFFAMAGLLSGCKQPAIQSDASSSVSAHQPPFQNESQFVVHAIASDLAEELYFAKFHQLPGKNFSTVVIEGGGSGDEPVYHIRIQFGSKVGEQNVELKIGGPIWSPEIYQPLVLQLAQAMKFRAVAASH